MKVKDNFFLENLSFDKYIFVFYFRLSDYSVTAQARKSKLALMLVATSIFERNSGLWSALFSPISCTPGSDGPVLKLKKPTPRFSIVCATFQCFLIVSFLQTGSSRGLIKSFHSLFSSPSVLAQCVEIFYFILHTPLDSNILRSPQDLKTVFYFHFQANFSWHQLKIPPNCVNWSSFKTLP